MCLLDRLAAQIPEVDDILVYTFDQESWVGSEFGNDSLAAGIPLHKRLPKFLTALCNKWGSLKPDSTMWWEPWEISAGQIYAMVDSLPTKNFGFMLHSNIAEVQSTLPVDRWLKNMVSICKKKNIPVAVELFLSSATEEVAPLQNIVSPRLVYNQLKAVKSLPYVSGVKEYFGNLPDKNDPNLKMAGVVFNNPDISLNSALNILAEEYKEGKEKVMSAWEKVATGMEFLPWDVAWTIRQLPRKKPKPHGWKTGAKISGRVAVSPSWKSTRRAIFMTTENDQLHPWFYEDFALRTEIAVNHFESAVDILKSSLGVVPEKFKDDINLWIKDISVLKTLFKDFQLYVQETLVCYIIGKKLSKTDTVPQEWYDRLKTLIELDVKNQTGYETIDKTVPSATEMLEKYVQDPKLWVTQYLIDDFL